MPISLDLPPELEAAARQEAKCRGMSLDQLLTWALIAQLPAEACPDVIRALFQQFREQKQAQHAVGSEDEREFDFDELARNMNANRAGERIPYPPEMKGITW